MSFDTDKEVKNILFDLGVEGNEYGDLVEYISNLHSEVKRLREEKTFLWETYLKESAEVKRLTAMYEETNHHLDLMVGAFGIEPLVEMVGEEE